jgi:hypothetical protein
MMRHAWDGYARNAWGANEIKPISGQPSDGIALLAELFFWRGRFLLQNSWGANDILPISGQPLDVSLVWVTFNFPRGHIHNRS